MKRFTNPVPQFFDNAGNILSVGKVNFYENGSTTTRKNTYNANSGSLNTNPVNLSDSGRIPPVYGEGLYTVVVTDADGVQIWQRNDVEFGDDGGQFAEWSSVRSYLQGETARYTDGYYYISESNNNLGNAPPVATSKWSRIAFLEYWNADKPGGYSLNAIVVDGGKLYRSKINTNESLTSVTADWEGLSFTNFIDGDLTVDGNVITTHEGVARRKTTLSIVSDTTLNRDTDLTVSGLVNGWYWVNGVIEWNANSGGAANRLQITFDGDVTTNLQKVVWQDYDSTALSTMSSITTPNFQNAGASDRLLTFSGMVRLDSGGQLGLWVSQFASSATAIDIKHGSLYVKRVGDGI